MPIDYRLTDATGTCLDVGQLPTIELTLQHCVEWCAAEFFDCAQNNNQIVARIEWCAAGFAPRAEFILRESAGQILALDESGQIRAFAQCQISLKNLVKVD